MILLGAGGTDFYPRRVRFGTYPPGFLLESAGLTVFFARQYNSFKLYTFPLTYLYTHTFTHIHTYTRAQYNNMDSIDRTILAPSDTLKHY